MKKYLAFGFIVGLVILLFFYVAVYIFVIAPLAYKYEIAEYNRSIPRLNSYIECWSCINNGSSPYDCAVNTVNKNTYGVYNNAKINGYFSGNQKVSDSAVAMLTDMCSQKSVDQLMREPRLLGTGTTYSCEMNIIYGKNSSFESECKSDIQSYCSNPSKLKEKYQEGTIAQICGSSSIKELPPIPTIGGIRSQIFDINEVVERIQSVVLMTKSQSMILLLFTPLGLGITIVLIVAILILSTFSFYVFWKRKLRKSGM